jgi:hypothetical protein
MRRLALVIAFSIAWLGLIAGRGVAADAGAVVQRHYRWQRGDTLTNVLYRHGLGHAKGPLQLYGPDGWMKRNLKANPGIKSWDGVSVGQTVELVLPASLAGAGAKGAAHVVKKATKLAPVAAKSAQARKTAMAAKSAKPAKSAERARGAKLAKGLAGKKLKELARRARSAEVNERPALAKAFRAARFAKSGDAGRADDDDGHELLDRARLETPSGPPSVVVLLILLPLLLGTLTLGATWWWDAAGRALVLGSRLRELHAAWKERVGRLLTCEDAELEKLLDETPSDGSSGREIAAMLDEALFRSPDLTRQRARIVYRRLGLVDTDRMQLAARRAEDRIAAAMRLSALGDPLYTKEIVEAFEGSARVTEVDILPAFVNIAGYDSAGLMEHLRGVVLRAPLRAGIRALSEARVTAAVDLIDKLAAENPDDDGIRDDAEEALHHLRVQQIEAELGGAGPALPTRPSTRLRPVA